MSQGQSSRPFKTGPLQAATGDGSKTASNVFESVLRGLQRRMSERGAFAIPFIFPPVGPLLQVRLTGCGYSRVTTDYNWDGLKRGDSPLTVLQYTLSGRGRLSYDGDVRDLVPGDLMIVHIPHRHRYWLPEETAHWEFMYLVGTGSELRRLCLDLERRRGPVFQAAPDGAAIRAFESLLAEGRNGKLKTGCDASARVYSLLMTLTESFNPGRIVDYPRPVRRAVDLCKRQYALPLSVADLAATAGMSRFHFTRLFKRAVGMTPHRYLTYVRIERAADLLSTRGHSVKSAARQTGFSDPSYFCKVFHGMMGTSPGSFRRNRLY